MTELFLSLQETKYTTAHQDTSQAIHTVATERTHESRSSKQPQIFKAAPKKSKHTDKHKGEMSLYVMLILLAEARKLTASKEVLLWMTPSETWLPN